MAGMNGLKAKLEKLIPREQRLLRELKKQHGPKVIDTVTVEQVLGGARSIKSMLTDTSELDPMLGIRVRGFSLPELCKVLPSRVPGGEPQPEGMLWLLLTGELPSPEEVASITTELRRRAPLPPGVEKLIRSLPKNTHPMTQLSTAILAMQSGSHFAAAYAAGVPRTKYWEAALDDSLDLIARLPRVCALIYRCTYHDGKVAEPALDADYAAGFGQMLGFDSHGFHEMMRLYLTIHADHEGGNASAHTGHLVASTLADPYLALSASMNALAGPLHGRANQEVLQWLLGLQKTLKDAGKPVTPASITEFAWSTLKAGQVIPGYGHAVLRTTDPRYLCQRDFAAKHLPNDPLFKLVDTVFQVMPGVLKEHGKTKNPYPNVDSHSGVLLSHYGLNEHDYYTVLFGAGRAFGVLSQLTLARALQLPIERPKSVTSAWLREHVGEATSKL